MNTTKNRAVAIVNHADGTQSTRNLKTTQQFGRHNAAFAVVEKRRNNEYAEWLRNDWGDDAAAIAFAMDNPQDFTYTVVHWTSAEQSANKWMEKQVRFQNNMNRGHICDYYIVNTDIVEFGA